MAVCDRHLPVIEREALVECHHAKRCFSNFDFWVIDGRDSIMQLVQLQSNHNSMNFSFGSVVLDKTAIAGEGAYSIVYTAKNARNRHTKYAIKKMIAHSSEMEALINVEITALQRFKHPNIILLLGHVDTIENNRKVVYLAFPYITNGSLRDKLNLVVAGHERPLEAGQILPSFLQILSAANILHTFQPSYIHQDIKPENILIDSDGRPLLTDFGSVREADITVRSRNQALSVVDEASRMSTMSIRAPELFDPPTNCRLDCRSDVWSLGCLLFAWRFGYSPFECMFSDTGGVKVTECSYSRVLSRLPIKPQASLDDTIILDITEWILQKDISKRPYTSDVITHVMDKLETIRFGDNRI